MGLVLKFSLGTVLFHRRAIGRREMMQDFWSLLAQLNSLYVFFFTLPEASRKSGGGNYYLELRKSVESPWQWKKLHYHFVSFYEPELCELSLKQKFDTAIAFAVLEGKVYPIPSKGVYEYQIRHSIPYMRTFRSICQSSLDRFPSVVWAELGVECMWWLPGYKDHKPQYVFNSLGESLTQEHLSYQNDLGVLP